MEPAAIRIGYSQGDPQIPFRAALEYGIKERAAHHGVQLHLQPAFSIDEQCSAIVQLADAKVDVLLIGPIDSVGIVPAVAYANRVGVPVVTLDMALNDGEVASSVVSDSAHGALLAAERIAQLIDERGKLLHIQGVVTNETSATRSQGFRGALAGWPQIEVVRAASAAWQAAQAAALTAQTLSEHPDLRAIFAENDEMALGAIAALRAAGRDDVVVVGFDGDARALRALHEGSLAATVAQSPRAISHAAFAAALQVARGARVAALELVPVRLIDRATMLETALDTLEIVPGLLGDVVRGAAEERRLQQQVIDAQQRMITMLSSPLVPISDDILVLPLIGPIDARRAQQIAETLLTGIVKQQAEWVIIDVTGVPLVDAQVAHYMLQAMRAVRLIGATPVLVGLGPQAAQMLIELAIDLSEVVVRGTLQRGLEYANAQRAAKRGIT